MARKKGVNNTEMVVKHKDEARSKYGKSAFYMLFGLVGEILVCLIYGWLSGNTGYNKTSDNVVTALLQNYNFIFGFIILIPVIMYIFSKAKDELKKKFITEEQSMMYGFFGVILLIVGIISVCSVVYPINSATYYGSYSAVTVSIFLCSVVTLILVSIVYAGLKLPSMLKNKGELWTAIKKYSPIILMVMFLVWTFISCMLAPEAADNIIGEKVAESVGAKPDAVLAKTLNGCYNLKDGYWAFLLYGSVMLGAMLMGKERVKEKKTIIAGFTIVITLLSIGTLWVTNYYNSTYKVALDVYLPEYEKAYEQYYVEDSGDYDFTLTLNDFTSKAKNEAKTQAQNKTYPLINKLYIYPQRGIFRNSNHFAYVLCIVVLASAGLALVEKNVLYKFLYLLAFAINTAMLIVNNTFGGYLGVLVALIFFVIYNIFAFIFKAKKPNSESVKSENTKDVPKYYSLIVTLLIVAIFGAMSFSIKDGNGKPTAVNNINRFVKDIGAFGGYMLNEENPTDADVSELDISITKAGSGRGETWIKVWELVEQRPMFGYGLECLLFQFAGQFDVNEGRTHNLLLQLLATVGIPGTLMYFSALAIIFIRLLKNWKTWDDIEKICVFVGISYMVTALTGNTTYYTSPYFMMFLGFVVLTPWKRNQEDMITKS